MSTSLDTCGSRAAFRDFLANPELVRKVSVDKILAKAHSFGIGDEAIGKAIGISPGVVERWRRSGGSAAPEDERFEKLMRALSRLCEPVKA
jgi:hypothetical protein